MPDALDEILGGPQATPQPKGDALDDILGGAAPDPRDAEIARLRTSIDCAVNILAANEGATRYATSDPDTLTAWLEASGRVSHAAYLALKEVTNG